MMDFDVLNMNTPKAYTKTMVTIYHISVSMVTMSHGRHPWLPTTMACNHGNHVSMVTVFAFFLQRQMKPNEKL